MSEAKLEFHIGNVSFVGEGQQEWLSEQLDKVLDHFGDTESLPAKETEISKERTQNTTESKSSNSEKDIYQVNLSTFLKEQNATSNQRLKFLAAATWLAKNNENDLQTIDVANALKESRQPSLSNAADCLNKNDRQGYCEKDGDHFFVTPQGFDVFENPEEE